MKYSGIDMYSHCCRSGGIGRQLLVELVQRAQGADIFLTTLGGTTHFYAPQGFRTLERGEIPRCCASPFPFPLQLSFL